MARRFAKMAFALPTSVVVCGSLAGTSRRAPTPQWNRHSVDSWPPPCCVWRCATSWLQGSTRTPERQQEPSGTPIGTTWNHHLWLSHLVLTTLERLSHHVTACHICFRNSWDSQLATANASEDPWQNSSRTAHLSPLSVAVGRGSQRVPGPSAPSVKAAVAPQTESRR